MLTKLFENPNVTEITINHFTSIWYECEGKLHPFNESFTSEHAYYLFIKEICRDINSDISLLRPFINAQWKGFRVHLVNEHLSKNNFLLSFRRIKNTSWSLEELHHKKFFNEQEYNAIQQLVSGRKTLLIVGPTGSGKTSFLGALLHSLPENERCVILEDTDELHLPNKASTKLLCFDQEHELVKKVDLQDLVKQSLRMRPDRLVVGEIRSTEAKDLLMALSTGHAGSMGTLHASSAQEALLRLEMLVQIGAPQWSLETVRRLIFLSVQAIIVVGKDASGLRGIRAIEKLHSLESFGIITESYLFTTLPSSKRWEGTGPTTSPF